MQQKINHLLTTTNNLQTPLAVFKRELENHTGNPARMAQLQRATTGMRAALFRLLEEVDAFDEALFDLQHADE